MELCSPLFFCHVNVCMAEKTEGLSSLGGKGGVGSHRNDGFGGVFPPRG